MTPGVVFGHLTFALLVFLFLPSRPLDWRMRVVLLAALLGISFIEVEGLSLGDYTRSYTDDLAISTLLWLSYGAVIRLLDYPRLARVQQRELALCFAGMAIFLYPATLGLSQLDPYRLGFAPLPLLSVVAGLCLWFWWRQNRVAMALLMVPTLSYWLNIKDSDNFWDYIIDPLFGLYCCAFLIADAWRNFRGLRLRAGDLEINAKPNNEHSLAAQSRAAP